MDRPGSAMTSTLAGLALLASLFAVVFSLLTLTAPASTPGAAPPPAPTTIDLSLLITGRGAIGGRYFAGPRSSSSSDTTVLG